MGRNASLLVLMLVLLGGLFAWLLTDVGTHASDALTGQDPTEELLGERQPPTAPDAPVGDDPTDQDTAREAIGLAPSLDPESVLAGLVPLDRTRVVGRLLDPEGRPLRGRTLGLIVSTVRAPDLDRIRQRDGVLVELEATTDDEGRFAFGSSPVTSTWHYLHAEHPSYPSLVLGPVNPVPGRDTDLGDLRFGRGATLPLRVTDRGDLAIGGAEVLLAVLPTGSSGRGGGSPVSRPAGWTLADGTLLLEGLAPGRYMLGARSPRHAIAWSDVTEVTRDLPPAEVVLALAEGHELLGRVVDAETRAGVAGAEVMLSDRGWAESVYEITTTDDDGRFVRPSTAKNRRLRYQVRADGYLPAWGNLREEDNTAGQLEQVVEVTPAARIEVLVVADSGGEPLADARLYLANESWGGPSSSSLLGQSMQPMADGNPGGAADLSRTDAAGLATVTLPGNDKAMMVRLDGFVTHQVDLPRDRTQPPEGPIEVRLQRGAGITALVRGPDGELPGARVELCLVSTDASEGDGTGGSSSGNNRRWQRAPTVLASELVWSDMGRLLPVGRRVTDAGGQAYFGTVREGLFRLVASAPGLGQAISEPLRLRGDEESLEIPLELLPAGRIQGRVLLRGEPEPDQRIVAMRELRAADSGTMPAEAEVRSTRSDDEGNFELDGLGAGSWKVFALRPGEVEGSPANGSRAVTRQIDRRAMEVDLVAGDVRTIELEAQSPGAILSGRVKLNHQPRGDVQVRARLRDPDGGRGQSVSGRTDSAGRYRLEGLLEGDWDLEVSTDSRRSRDLYADRFVLARQLVRIGDVEEVERDVSIEVGALTVNLTAPDLPPDANGNARKLSWISMQLQADEERGGVVGLTGAGTVRAWFPVDRDVELDDVPIGAYKVRLTEGNIKPVNQAIDIDAGLGLRLEVVLEGKDGQ